MKKKLCAALAAMALFAAAFAFVACGNDSASSNDSYVSGNIGTGGNGTGGGDNTGNEGEGEEGGGNENGNESGDNDEPSEKIANVTDVIKLVIGEPEYTQIAGNVSSGNLTLKAQTIKKVGDTFSDLSKYEGKEKKEENIDAEHKTFISEYKDVLVAQAENFINVSKSGTKYTVTYGDKKINFSGDFNLSEISLPTNNGNGNFSSAKLIGDKISIDKLNTIRGNSLPTLQITNVIKEDDRGLPVANRDKHLYNLYKDYSAVLTKLQISGSFSGTEINGKKISSDTNYTLLSDENTVKSSLDTSVKSLPVDALIQMYQQLKISYFVNMIISGTPTATDTVEVAWQLTNIVFEGDMSKIKNIGQKDLTGIVYFKKKAYNTNRQAVNGLLKLDSLEGVSNGTFGIDLSEDSAVLDVRGGGDTSVINSYNSNLLVGGGYAHAIYFSDYFSNIKDDQTKINELCDRFSNKQGMAKFIYAYLGNNKVKGQDYADRPSKKTYGTPRTLRDFECYGNNGEFPDGEYYAQNDKKCGIAKRFV